MKVKIMYSNTHVGQGLKEGGLLRTAKRVNPDILCVVEVNRPVLRRELRRQFPSDIWGCYGLRPPALSAAAPGNHILWRKSVFDLIRGDREFLSRQLWDGIRRDKWHPSRRICHVRLRSRYRVDGKPWAKIAVGCDHLWTTAGHRWERNDRVIQGHKHQADRSAAAAGDAQSAGFPTFNVGDYNEYVNNTPPRSFIEMLMLAEDMRRVSDNLDHHLDAAFASPDVRIEDMWWVSERELTTDHPGLVTVVKI